MKFWNFKNLGSSGELYLYGEISDTSWWGDEVTPAQFQSDLAALGDISELNIYINSPGGDVFAGFALYNILNRHPATKIVHIDGLAASAASVVAMAADTIVMPAASTMMIHKAWTFAYGNSSQLQEIAVELERIDGQLAQIYSDRTGIPVDDVAELLASETWMSGAEAVEKGFADELEENKKIAACADAEKWFARYQHPPKNADNGGAGQPVQNTDPQDAEKVEAQKQRFSFYKKIMEEQ